jgi:DNA-binding PucR family transcriptional regulator
MPPMDAAALRAALERQQSDLAPVARVLAAVAAFPPRLQPEDWRGEAAEAAEHLEQQLRRQLREADAHLHAAVHATRAALLELDGPQ